MLDTGCWILDAGCWMLDAGSVCQLQHLVASIFLAKEPLAFYGEH